jgi:hypothetical protein
MTLNPVFRVGTSSRRTTSWSLPRPGGPRYIVVAAGAKCLVVEDLLHRQLRFRNWLGSSAVIVARADAAIQELQRQPFDMVFLDRDLGLNAGYGEDVAKFLAEMKPRFAGRVYIHSANHVAAEYMRKILADAGINVEATPFDLLGIIRENVQSTK